MQKLLGIVIICLFFAGCASTDCTRGNCNVRETYMWEDGNYAWENDSYDENDTDGWEDDRRNPSKLNMGKDKGILQKGKE